MLITILESLKKYTEKNSKQFERKILKSIEKQNSQSVSPVGNIVLQAFGVFPELPWQTCEREACGGSIGDRRAPSDCTPFGSCTDRNRRTTRKPTGAWLSLELEIK